MSPDEISRRRFIEGSALAATAATAATFARGRDAVAATGPGVGLLGEAMHAEVGYQHDLRAIKFETKDEGLWRRAHATRLNANLYPTHGLGPAAQAMGVNRGDQFDYLVAMAGNSRGLQDFQREHLPADDPRRKER